MKLIAFYLPQGAVLEPCDQWGKQYLEATLNLDFNKCKVG
jgi:hypothetical protein